ncbi:MAG: 2-oxoacid:acceptor oxidoreductase subunit alpha [Nitrososphaeria archaeon]|nr:2-oxoacid:acceptor oxidoreductase subunit alpha [Nitrososphaeria archaeon]NIN52182.1 2-oxoacid:acceptor oxidoreductase subunit alpha [Nitrososphaeria archaeon]NIQ32635.1 2-oxoacid:acceptor oxidoreductase subunit alpha [Nitrososphaeria archaeon]
MENTLSWKIGGMAGYGIMTTGLIFAKTCSRGRLHVFDTTEYPSLIRGGHNTYQVRASDEEVHSHKRSIDLLVALNREAINLHEDELSPGGGIIYDGEKVPLSREELGREDVHFISIPLQRLAEESGGGRVMINSVALGASTALIDYDFEILSGVLRDIYGVKGMDIAEYNVRAAKSGYEYVRSEVKTRIEHRLKKVEGPRRMLLTGNEAISLGAIKAGCKFVSAYPMTPSSSILHFMAAQERNFNIIVKHTEDEIAAINMAIGASFAGVRAMTCTSGGGFSLMAEALGLASMTETPLVIVEAQRPGPSTGLATRTEQGDLKFILTASQGDFPRFAVAPGDVEECFHLTIEAFNLAERYQCPAIIISDKFLSESHKTVEIFDVESVSVDRGLRLSDEELREIKDFKRYRFTDTGISPRSIPSQEGGTFKATGNEHDETGYMSEDKEIRRKMMEKRARKLIVAAKKIPEPKLLGPESADLTIIAWGSTKGPIREAMKLLKDDGVNANFLQIIYMSPFPSDAVSKVMDEANLTVLVENNFSGQLGAVIKEYTGKDVDHKILKYNGRQFFPGEIHGRVVEVL